MPKRVARANKTAALIRKSLLGLARGLRELIPLLAKQDGTAQDPRAGRTLKLSPKVRSLRKLQGQYMGYIRNLRPKQRARVKAVRSAKGYPAAVALAKELAKS